ncbi:MAG: Uma2 family endonuclease [Myxococcales bacterium]|nr:Uma2 family endonuclease [Myxococcales bacterium]
MREERFADAPVRPLRREEYDRLVRSGAFQDERIELLFGRLVLMSPQKALHAAVVQRLMELFMPRLLGRASVRGQLPLGASEESEPEPDVAIVPAREYLDDHPTEALLVVEVSDSTLRRDRVKGMLYAAMGAPEYWIVNLKEEVLEVYREPVGDEYTSSSRLGRGEKVSPVAFPEITVDVAELLPGVAPS